MRRTLFEIIVSVVVTLIYTACVLAFILCVALKADEIKIFSDDLTLDDISIRPLSEITEPSEQERDVYEEDRARFEAFYTREVNSKPYECDADCSLFHQWKTSRQSPELTVAR